MAKKEKNHTQRRLEDKVGESVSIIAEKTKIKGRIEGPDSILISGRYQGEIVCERLVRIVRGGKMDGPIRAPYVIIEGEVNGDISAAQHVELRSEGKVIGNISTEKFAMAEGSFLRGEIKMSKPEDKPQVFAEKRKR
jgi:cytoskeletal protein CcmA (bactofilin family)